MTYQLCASGWGGYFHVRQLSYASLNFSESKLGLNKKYAQCKLNVSFPPFKSVAFIKSCFLLN